MSKPTLDEMWAAYGGPSVYEGHIKDEKGKNIYGLCDYHRDAIFVNVKYAVVEVIVHELLHRKYPRRGEARIHKDAEQFVQSMTPKEIAVWYRRFQRVRKPSVLVEVEG